MDTLTSRIGLLVLAVCAIVLVFAAQPTNVSAAQPQVGEGSCTGERACEGLTGTAGDDSCNGFEACLNSSATIGDDACNGEKACPDTAGSIEDGSCNAPGVSGGPTV